MLPFLTAQWRKRTNSALTESKYDLYFFESPRTIPPIAKAAAWNFIGRAEGKRLIVGMPNEPYMTAASPSADTLDLKGLLDAANQASTQVALLHVAFMALSFYVLVIVSGTTDLDLLIGKGVKLPIVDVDVPIVGFYTTAPVIIVLVHFNLLLQLQLLSRKLYIFESKIVRNRTEPGGSPLLRRKTVCSERGIVCVDERDLLHIFPCTHFLIGQYEGLIRRCLSIVTALSLLILPLATLLLLQLRFLAYQSESITWFQRAAVWSDIGVIVALWPVIMGRSGRWSGFLRQVARGMRTHWFIALNALAVYVACVACLYTTHESFDELEVFRWIFLLALLGLFVVWLATAATLGWRFIRARHRALAGLKQTNASTEQRGVGAFIVAVAIGCSLPLALVVKGEGLEVSTIGETTFSRINAFRKLNAEGKTLLAKPPSAEVLDSLRGSLTQRLNGLSKVDRLVLSNRNFRGANFESAVLTGADFRGADLEGASFARAHIEGAQFERARLTGTVFWSCFAEASNFSDVHSPGGMFAGAHLETTNFSDADMEGADFSGGTQMDGAIFDRATLSGATFSGAHLKGASFACAKMSGVDLRQGQLLDTDFGGAETPWIDLRGSLWDPFSPSERDTLTALRSAVRYERSAYGLNACNAPDDSRRRFDSCLTDHTRSTQFACFKSWYPESIEGYRKQLYGPLGKLACSDLRIARNLMREVSQSLRGADPGSRLEHEFLLLLWDLRQDPKCQGLQDVYVLEMMLNADPKLGANEQPASNSIAQ